MSSVEEASAAVGGNAEQARELTSGITASKDTLDSLIGALAALGLDDKTGHARAASDRAQELAGHANSLADALDNLRAQVDALKGLLARASDGSPNGVPPSAPTTTLKGPAASTELTRVGKRHLLGQIRMNSPAKEKNTVVLPHVDTGADIDAIKTGRARYLRDNLYEVNNRVYGIETPSGTVYPVKGEGFVELDKLEFTALKGLLSHAGNRAAAERDPKVARFQRHMTDRTWARAQHVFEQRLGDPNA
ncbi:hypothetical protein GCM10009853_022700 [Glycomyces scopariae]